MRRKVKEMKKIFEKKEETVTQKAQTSSGVGNNWIEKIRKENEVEISRRTDLAKLERSRRTDFREEISRKRKKEVAENPEDSSKRNKWEWGRDFSTSGGKEHSFLKKDGLMGTGLLQNIYVESEQRRLGIWTGARNDE